MNTVTLPDGTKLPALGLGTWHMGESARARRDEVAAVRLALEIGYRVFDTAEMYGEGGAEDVLGQAFAEAQRAGTVAHEELFVVSKVYPHNASRAGVAAACDRSRKRLALDRIDLYLLHWPGPHPLSETIAGFEGLQTRGHIRHWGVSNFDLADMTELMRVRGGDRCATNQIWYSLSTRGPAFDLVPWLQRHGIATMAYSPIDQGELVRNGALGKLASKLGATPAQLALAWLTSQPGVMAIPKAASEAHLRENLASLALKLDAADLDELDAAFPPPRRKVALAML